ncbi:MAG: hypothetical protein HXY24_05440, partial [Rubrivivax sp.]|nr:hypothetical protein [Rubrivivax sp.]
MLSPTIGSRSVASAGVCCSGVLRRAGSRASPRRHAVQPTVPSSAPA